MCMKKFSLLLFVVFSFLFIVPNVYAYEDEVKVYLFKGETCGFCALAEEYFNELEDSYGEYFKLKKYEVWYNENNAELMEDVADYLNTEVEGVPFIVIGDEYFNGFNDYIGRKMLDKILSEYEKDVDDRVDVIERVKYGYDSDSDDDDYYYDFDNEFFEFFEELENVEDFEDFEELGPLKYLLAIPVAFITFIVMFGYKKNREAHSNYSEVVSRGRFR